MIWIAVISVALGFFAAFYSKSNLVAILGVMAIVLGLLAIILGPPPEPVTVKLIPAKVCTRDIHMQEVCN